MSKQIHECLASIFEHKKKLGELTQRQLSKLSGVDASSISNFFSGRRTINVRKLMGIVNALGVRWHELDVTTAAPVKLRPDEHALYPNKTHAELHRKLQEILQDGPKKYIDGIATNLECAYFCTKNPALFEEAYRNRPGTESDKAPPIRIKRRKVSGR